MSKKRLIPPDIKIQQILIEHLKLASGFVIGSESKDSDGMDPC